MAAVDACDPVAHVVQRSFDVSLLDRCLVPSVRAVCWDTTANKLVLGTSGSEIYELSSLTGVDANGGPLLQGHFQGQLWAIGCHPTKARVPAAEHVSVKPR